MKKLLRAIRNRKAEGYIDTGITIFVLAMILLLIVNVFSLLMLKQHVDHMAKELIEVTTMYGRVDAEANERLAALTEQTGINPAISYDGTEYMDAGNKIQLGKQIMVTVTSTMELKGLGVFRIPVTIQSTQSGLSQVYWK